MLAFLSVLNVNPYWYLLAAVPSSLLGGFPAILMSITCYVTDISNNDNRTWHFAWMNCFYLAGLLVGLLVGPIVFKIYGYLYVFSISSVFILIAWLYSLFFLEETIQNNSSMKVSFTTQ